MSDKDNIETNINENAQNEETLKKNEKCIKEKKEKTSELKKTIGDKNKELNESKKTIEDKDKELNKLKKTIEDKDKELNDYIELLRSSRAEFDNYRKRTNKEKETIYDDGFGDAIKKILPIVDNFERAVECGPSDETNDSFYEGIKMVLKQIKDCFSSCGVEEISALNEKFDPNFHNAVMHEENSNYGENEVIEVLQKGYKYKDRILRYSMVKVAN